MNKRILAKMPETKMPLISVIIPTYNRSGSLRAAVKSALAQNYHEIEVVVVDDCSTDDTPQMLEKMAAKSPNLRVLRHETNKGAAAARNTGIQAARGAWIALLDSDDLWVVDKLTRQMEYLEETKSLLCVCNAVFRKADGESLAERALPTKIDWKQAVIEGLGLNSGSALLARKNLFDEVGLYDESMKRLEDWDWFIRLVLKGHLPDNAPFNGSIIQVGAPPRVEAVKSSADILHSKHAWVIYETFGSGMSDRFQAALELEVAAARLWQRDFIGFTKGWFDAAVHYPPLAARFMTTRVARVLSGDAPRFFNLFRKAKREA